MNASILKVRTSVYPADRGLPAGLIEQIAAPSEFARFFGAHMVQVHAALCHPEIEAGDCIAVDFDRREIGHDGLYMITISHDDGSKWYGARRFQFRPADEGSALWCFDLGGESWSPVTREMRSRITVCGEIREVYKPASKLRRL
jgi:hypothetical protein